MLPLAIISERLRKLKDWALEINSITKDFMFGNFKEAMGFVNRVAELTEQQEHYPMITVSGNRVKINLTTHSEGGLTSKDFELAEEIDKLE